MTLLRLLCLVVLATGLWGCKGPSQEIRDRATTVVKAAGASQEILRDNAELLTHAEDTLNKLVEATPNMNAAQTALSTTVLQCIKEVRSGEDQIGRLQIDIVDAASTVATLTTKVKDVVPLYLKGWFWAIVLAVLGGVGWAAVRQFGMAAVLGVFTGGWGWLIGLFGRPKR